MSLPTITKSAQAYKGQSVICEYDSNVFNTVVLPNIKIGDPVGVASSDKGGVICEIDEYGLSFKVTPLQPDFRFDSDGTPGILQNGETVVFSIE